MIPESSCSRKETADIASGVDSVFLIKENLIQYFSFRSYKTI